MDQDIQIQDVSKYQVETLLTLAINLLLKNKQLVIEIKTFEWTISSVSNTPLLKIRYAADGNNVVIQIVESVFKDYNRPFDASIGIDPAASMKTKTVLRLAYLLYSHRND